MTFPSLFRRKPRHPFPLQQYPGTMREFRAIAENRNGANRILQSAEFIQMYSVLVNERPSKSLIPGLPMHVNAAHAMYCKGYEDCLERFQLLGLAEGIPELPEMTFREEE